MVNANCVIEPLESLNQRQDCRGVEKPSEVGADTDASGGQEAVVELTPDTLLAGGMSRVEAWIAAPRSKAKRKARNERYREQQEASGITQVSLRIPADMAQTFKELASRACETGVLPTCDGTRVEVDHRLSLPAPGIAQEFEEMKGLLATLSDDLSAPLAEALQSSATLRAMLDESRERDDQMRKRLSDLEARDKKTRELADLGQQVSSLTGVRGLLMALLLRLS